MLGPRHITRHKRKTPRLSLRLQNRSTNRAPPATNNSGQMCFLGKEVRNELLSQKFLEGGRIGHCPHGCGRGHHVPSRRCPNWDFLAHYARESVFPYQWQTALRGIRSAHHAMGGDRRTVGSHRNESKLQSREL